MKKIVKGKRMRKMLTGAIALFLLNSVDAALVITSQGAWTNTAIITPSNGGTQVNTNTTGNFGAAGTKSFYSVNSTNSYMTMQTAAGNVQQNYTAGYTYNYTVSGYAAAASSTNANMLGWLLGNGAVISGTAISGLNNTGGYNASGTGTAANAISGSYAVSSNSAEAGQTIGLKISSDAAQTRFFANGSTTVKTTLTDHTGINNGNIYSTSFSTNAAGLIATDYVLDMKISETGAIVGDSGYFRMNNNTTVRNTLTLGSADDTFRTNTTYRISFDANKQISGDSAQNGLTVSLGTFSTNITIGAATTNYSFDVNATSAGIAGKLLNIGMIADAVTAAGTNQYRIYDLNIQALPESATFILTVTGGSGSGSYSNGAVVNITADAPAIGKTFDVWTGGTQYVTSVSSSNTTVTIPAQAVALTATYKDLVYTLTGSAGANGTVTPSSTNVVYGSNADFVVTASNYSGSLR